MQGHAGSREFRRVIVFGVLWACACDGVAGGATEASLPPEEGFPSVASAVGEPCTPGTSAVVLNEIRLVPSAIDFAYVELHNPGFSPVDIGGDSLVFQVDTGSYQTLVSVVLPEPQVIPAGGFLLACVDPDPARNAGIPGCQVTLAGLMPGTWRMVALWDGAQEVYLDRIDFASDQFPTTASIALRNPLLDNALVMQPTNPDDPSAWQFLDFGLSSRTYGSGVGQGTPGEANSDVFRQVDLPACDDGDPCTWDRCVSGTCDSSQHKPGCCTQDLECFDANLCTTDRCIGNTCTWTRDPDCCRVNSDCDDGNTCTRDICTASRCMRLPRAGCCTTASDCDDRSPCTHDTCLLGQCFHAPNVEACCLDDAWCHAYADDRNPCSAERCVEDPASGVKDCQHVFSDDCLTPLPLVESFDGTTTIAQRGWSFLDLGSPAADHWSQTGTGDLGPDGHLRFTWLPSVDGAKSYARTPTIDARASATISFNVTNSTSVQWRMKYRHGIPGRTVNLKVLASDTGDFSTAEVIWSRAATEDLPYSIETAAVPSGIRAAQTLRVAFLVDTGDSTTADLDAWEIDDVRVAAGVPNHLVKAMAVRCPTHGTCSSANWTTIATVAAPTPIPDVTMNVCERVRLVLCMRDVDAYYGTWQIFGYPASFVDSTPMDVPPFLQPSGEVGQANGCETLGVAVAAVCGIPSAATEKGWFYCAMDAVPGCDDAAADRYRTGLRTVDEYDPGAEERNSPFESLASLNLNVLLRDGYVVWSPNGWTDPSAIAVRDAIRAAGRKAQVVKDLDLLPQLQPYQGIWAVLGVSGRYHQVTSAEAARLKAYLDGGGRMVLEGGEFFTKPAGVQADTVLHPYFKVRTVHSGAPKLEGPVSGRNFLEGYVFDCSQDAAVNAGNDAIEHLPEQGGKEILRVEGGTTQFSTSVAFRNGTYRTIGSTLPYAGLLERSGGGLLSGAMARMLTFLENGSVECTSNAQCEDYEACTTDACQSGSCRNDWRSGCVPCVNDAVRPSGASACSTDTACRPDLGYCVSVRCNGNYCSFRRDAASPDVPVQMTAANPHFEVPVAVTRTGLVGDLQVKVKARSTYRGYLRLALRGPDGTEVVLKEAVPTDAKANVYETYDIGVPLPSGQSLDAFLEHEYLGTWTLVVDNLDPEVNTGWLDGWYLWVGKSPKCWFLAHCDDYTVCTTDACTDGYCRNTWINCNDGNACTDDGCNAVTGCTHANHGRACEDGDACTFGDACSGGACIPGGPRDCDDHNPCTDDSCDPATGCLHVANDANPCGDGDPCTNGDHCASGTCTGTVYACDDGIACTDDACNGDGTCTAELWSGWCLIGAVCREAGEPDPSDPCKACDPDIAPTAWSARPEDSPCGTDMTCRGGECLPIPSEPVPDTP